MSIDFFVKLRDLCDKEIEKQKPPELEDLPESVFMSLKYQERNSEKLKIFEFADKNDNDPVSFDVALQAIQERGATIANRFHLEGYSFEYWNWKDRIFRKKLS